MFDAAKEEKPERESAGEDASPEVADKEVQKDDSCLLEQYNPVPYIFVLKDANGIEVALPPKRLLNARIECPRFHVLLDHLLAVLWSYYSKQGLDLLESNQLHWALKILEGTKNKLGQYTDDVQMAMDHLTDAYVDVCSNSDITKLENRSYVQKTLTPVRRQKRKDEAPDDKREASGGYEGFKGDLQQQEMLQNASLHLADMICDADPDVIEEILVSKGGLPGGDYICIRRQSTPNTNLPGGNMETEQNTIVELRNNKFQEVVNILEEIRKLDETIQELPANRGDALKLMLADVLTKPEEETAKEDAAPEAEKVE